MTFMGWTELPVLLGVLRKLPLRRRAHPDPARPRRLRLRLDRPSGAGSSGVYFAIITQALTYVAMLLMFRNDTGFGGNNGMTGFTSILGMEMGAPSTAIWLATASTAATLAAFLLCGRLVNSPFGRMLVAVRDDEARLRFLGYDPVLAEARPHGRSRPCSPPWRARSTCRRSASSTRASCRRSCRSRSRSGSRSAGAARSSGAVIGAAVIIALKFWLTGFAPDLWPFILGASRADRRGLPAERPDRHPPARGCPSCKRSPRHEP